MQPHWAGNASQEESSPVVLQDVRQLGGRTLLALLPLALISILRSAPQAPLPASLSSCSFFLLCCFPLSLLLIEFVKGTYKRADRASRNMEENPHCCCLRGCPAGRQHMLLPILKLQTHLSIVPGPVLGMGSFQYTRPSHETHYMPGIML